jgi:hypothetical protein
LRAHGRLQVQQSSLTLAQFATKSTSIDQQPYLNGIEVLPVWFPPQLNSPYESVQRQGTVLMNFLFFAFNLPRLNLHAQIALVLLLSIGMLLTRVKRFRLHAILQSAVVLLNLGYILRIMLPSLRHQLPASCPMSRKDLPVAIVLLHSFVGALAWLMAFYVILAAGTPLIPRRFCFTNYRRWMWTVFVLWWAAFLLRCLVYYQRYVNP